MASSNYSRIFHGVALRAPIAFIGLFGIVSLSSAQGGPFTNLKDQVPPAVGRSVLVGKIDPSVTMHVSVAIPPANAAALQAFVDDVNNPHSPNYLRFLTPAEVGSRFGQSAANVQKVVSYLTSKGFRISLVAQNRMTILADCTAAQAESAFQTSISRFHAKNPNEPGRVDYFSYTRPLKAPRSIAPYIQHVGGLQNYTKPRHSSLTPSQTRTLYNSAPLWTDGFHGEGRTIGISSWDGFQLSNVPLFYSQFSLPTPPGGVGSNVSVVTVQGGSQNGTPAGEGDLDVQMPLGMAPLAQEIIYDGGGDELSVLAQEANDNKADVISESYGWNLDDQSAIAGHNVHLSMAAQGITYLCASGDFGTGTEPFIYPVIDPEVMQVGGTVSTTDAAGNRQTEVGWDGSGGGWFTRNIAFNKRPTWQVGAGVPTSIPFRMGPDVALQAASPDGAYDFIFGGQLATGDGTSFSSPICAGNIALVEQKLINDGGLPANLLGKQRLGRIQERIYAEDGDSSIYYDVTSGSNGVLPNGKQSVATVGWDTVTGWGPIDFDAFEKSLIVRTPKEVPVSTIGIYNNQGTGASGGVADVAATDQRYYSLASVRAAPGNVAAAQMDFTLDNGNTKLFGLTLTLVTSALAPATNFVYMYNFNTGQYDVVKASPLKKTDGTTTIQVDMTKYVGPNGQVSVIDRAVFPSRLQAVPFRLRIDEASLLELF